MVYNVLPNWPFISVMQSHFKNQVIKVQIIHVSYLNIDTELFASYKETIFYILQFELKKLVKNCGFSPQIP